MVDRPRIRFPPSDEYAIGYWIEAAKRGNRRAAMALLAEFVYWADVGEPLEPELAAYFADAFYEVCMDEMEVADALHLPKRMGRPERKMKERAADLRLGLLAWSRKRRGLTYQDAIQTVAEDRHASVSKVEREYRFALEVLGTFSREIDPDDKYGLRTRQQFRSDKEIEEYIEERRTSARSLDIANAVDGLLKSGVSQDEAANHVARQMDIAIAEVNEALQWYDDWLKTL